MKTASGGVQFCPICSAPRDELREIQGAVGFDRWCGLCQANTYSPLHVHYTCDKCGHEFTLDY